ncbi:hypothetical protein FB45DRAFT_875488 [Roridomyces roridus]|uniref:DUF6570 domain-containing protein n=1 Tax=Roridomyces roridus TaxID=1738132 RepID=A0AAD7B5J8_9AGAR|nr:hypothetical protein FB45DRAFT_875488 [Roridomyces roridus]
MLPATFCGQQLSTSLDTQSLSTRVSLDWILDHTIRAPASVASGLLFLPSADSESGCSMHVDATVCAGLPCDLVLGRDWLHRCQITTSHASVMLSSGIVDLRASAHGFTSPDPSPPSRSESMSSEMCETVLKLILDATDKQLSTESLLHVAAALDITISGTRNLRFKLRGEIRKHQDTIRNSGSEFQSSASMADFFDSFDSHTKPVLLSIAALHQIPLRDLITQHILFGNCTQFSDSHPQVTLANGLKLPGCADVHEEWRFNALESDFQAHVLMCIYGSNIRLNALRRVLDILKVEYDSGQSLGQLRRLLKHQVTVLRRGKKAELVDEERSQAQERFNLKLDEIHRCWPQLVPQSLKNQCIRNFRERTGSEALSTFTCAVCAESSPLRSHCSVAADDPEFDLSILQQPDDTNVLDMYKWLHPECEQPPMPYDEGPLRNLLVDPDGVTFSAESAVPTLSMCKCCHSSLKRKKLPALALANRTFLGPVPPELQDLTMIEESMLARCRSKCWIIQLNEENQEPVINAL